MKKGLIAIIILMISLRVLHAVGCGNDQQKGPASPGGPPPNNNTGSDPINVYTGNEFREVPDLQVYGSVGDQPLAFTRYTTSRFGPTAEPFGAGNSIRHGYEWEMADYTPSSSGAAQVQVSYPNGDQNIFTQVSSTKWTSTSSVSDILYQNGTQFTLQTKECFQYNFATIPAGTSHYYQMQTFVDSHQNVTTLSYDGGNRVSQVTEPAGRYLKLSYSSYYESSLPQTKLATVTTAPSPGQWLTVAIAHPTALSYLSFFGASTCEIAEIQFLDAHGNVISGTPFGTNPSTPTNGVANAFDGDPTTYFESSDVTGGYVGIYQGTGTPVAAASVRILARSGYESSLVNATIYGNNSAPVTASVITQVQSSDGRAVSYSYNYNQIRNGGTYYAVLNNVAYPDGTAAQYTYSVGPGGKRPDMTAAVDPRYPLRFTQIHEKYDSSIGGAVIEQDAPNGAVMCTIGIQNGDPHIPTITEPHADGTTGTTVFNEVNGLPKTKVDALGRTFGFTAPSGGFLTAMADPLGHVTGITPSLFNNPLTIKHPDNSTLNWTRDSLDLPLTYSDELSHTTTYTRDTSHRLTAIAYPDGTNEAYTYNGFGQITSHTLRNGATESSIYDGRGLLQSFTDAAGQTSTFSYDSLDRPTSVTDANGHTTQYAYNDRGQITLITYADGSTYSYTYDTFGDKTSETNQVGQTWTYIYDVFKRVTSTTDPLGRTTAYTYGGGYEEKPITITLPSGRKTTFTYDAEWQMLTKTVGAGTSDAAATSYAYDNNGNVTSMTDPNGHVWSYTYDTRNRKLTETDPLGHTTSYAYDAANNVSKVTRPDGGVTTNTYDTMNRLLTTTDPKGETTAYTYDASGNMLTVTDARGNTYSYTYDLKNRKTSMTYPDGSHESYGYDGVGNLITYTTRAGQVETNTYDSRNRELSSTWSDAVTPNIIRSYDATGRLTSTANGVSTCTYTYDNANEELSETQNAGIGSGWTVSYSYDADGNKAGMTYPSGTAVTYGYTNRNQLNAVAIGGTSLAGYTYDANGNTLTKNLADGTLASYTYDTVNRLITLTHSLSGASFAQFDYGYDAVNRRTYEQRNQASGDVYSYDAVNQVASVNYDATNPTSGSSGANRTVGYTYDAVGNRMAVNDNVNGNASYTANSDNQYTNVGGSAYGYDGNGNLNTGNGLYTYDAQNRLIYAQLSTGTLGTGTLTSNIDQMSYDSKNRVVKRVVNGTPTYFVYDGGDLIEERDTNNNVLAIYVHGAGTDEILTRTAGGVTVYYHHNVLGSVVNLTDVTGTVLEKYKYDVFGKPTITDGSGNPIASSAYGNRFLFTGREYLAEVNLYDYRNRDYSPDLGRFLQIDPLLFSAGDINIYRYVGNYPIGYIDSTGLGRVFKIRKFEV